jgi:hypothetical protein
MVSCAAVVVPPPVAALATPSLAPALLALGAPASIVTFGTMPSTTTVVFALEDRTAPSLVEEVAALADRPRQGVPTAQVVEEAEPQPAEIEAVDVVEAAGSVDLALYAVELEGISQAAVATDEALVVEPIPTDPIECHQRGSQLPLKDENGAWDRNLIAQMTHTVFECVASVGGMASQPPTNEGWDAAAIWGFDSLARQVAAESVVVGYCESQAFADFAITGNNPWGYGGVFQMGAKEMRLFGFPGASKFEPVDNVYSAATYFMSMVERGMGWGGWGPWAVVNTGYNDEVNDRVKVPVLPRFTSTDPAYRGRRGVELPAWAVDPWRYSVPGFNGCPTTGHPWPAAVELAGVRPGTSEG